MDAAEVRHEFELVEDRDDEEPRCHNCQRTEREIEGSFDDPVADGRVYCGGYDSARCDHIARARLNHGRGQHRATPSLVSSRGEP